MAFVNVFFDDDNLPSLDLSNICGVTNNAPFAGTDLPDCSFLASDIATCQAAGKIVTISLGGGAGTYGFTSDTQAQTFADTIWNIFLGGSSTTRPFGAAVLDGVDLDIEGGSSTGYAAFVTQLRTHMDAADKTDAYLGSVISAVGFDALYVQFYNNYCGLTNYGDANDWDFADWDTWATSTSPNRDVKIYIGAPASSTAAGSGYVDAETLAGIITGTQSQYKSFGGVMLWDASQAYQNNRYDQAAKSALGDGSVAATATTTKSAAVSTATSAPPTTSAGPSTSAAAPTTSAPTSTSSKATSSAIASTTVGTNACGAVSAWMANVAYAEGSQVTYK
ncbi:hypothetical protein HWV62_8681 [Athelia sp. TMB]|nr:hypothetical protein HWV62_8681 [Athelia sp. TMB]